LVFFAYRESGAGPISGRAMTQGFLAPGSGSATASAGGGGPYP
jgi:hypothetical protein